MISTRPPAKWLSKTASSRCFPFVPGPDHPILVAGKPVSALRFALLGHIHSVVGILSYNGQVNATLTADDEAIPDVHLLPKFYTKALVDLGNEFNVEIPQSLKDCV